MLKNWRPHFSILFLGLFLIANATFYGHIIKTKVGPFYFAELIALIVVALNFDSLFQVIQKNFKYLKPFFAFFAWGLLLLLTDFLMGQSQVSTSRMFRHSILFTYPLIWSALGYWAWKKQENLTASIFFILLAANIVQASIELQSINFSLGPIFGVFFSYTIIQLLTKRKTDHPPAIWIFAIILSFASNIPFGMLILTSMSRSTLLLYVLTLVLVPILVIRKPNVILWKAIGIPIALLGLTLVAFPIGQNILKNTATPISEQILSSIQHKDDLHYPEYKIPKDEAPIFQMRSRRYWWKTALYDWSQNPIFGNRFGVEIPSSILKGYANDVNINQVPSFSTVHTPIAGPHNSYLTILARMGFIGLLLFYFIFVYWRRAFSAICQKNPLRLFDLLLMIISLNGFIFAIYALGFESPQNCVILWFTVGVLLARHLSFKKNTLTLF